MRSDTARIELAHLEGVLREAGIQRVPSVPPAPARGHAPGAAPANARGHSTGAAPALRPLGEQVAELERKVIGEALSATGGNKLAAAKLLGISRAKLYERLESMTESQAFV